MTSRLSRRMRGLAALCLAALLIGVIPSIAQESLTPPAAGERYDAPAYALHGPYWVGAMEFTIEDSERPLSVMIWYPALNPEGLVEEIDYAINHGSTIPSATIAGHAIADALPDAAGAPYPLVIYSPGGGAMPQHHAYLIQHLASHGFIVAAAPHPGNSTPELMDSFLSEDQAAAFQHGDALSTAYRPLDVRREIDFADTLTQNDSPLAGLIDMNSIAVIGPSSGGYTALAAAGARINFSAFAAWCAAEPELCTMKELGYYPPYEAEIASLAGVGTAVDGLWPSLGDSRIDAMISLSPGSVPLFGAEGLASVSIPSLFVVGSADPYGFDDDVEFAFGAISSAVKAKVTFENAEHMLANFACADSPDYVALGFSVFCMDSVWDMPRVHDLINHFSTAFLLDVLKGDPDAHAALAPDAVSFTGILYEEQGF